MIFYDKSARSPEAHGDYGRHDALEEGVIYSADRSGAALRLKEGRVRI